MILGLCETAALSFSSSSSAPPPFSSALRSPLSPSSSSDSKPSCKFQRAPAHRPPLCLAGAKLLRAHLCARAPLPARWLTRSPVHLPPSYADASSILCRPLGALVGQPAGQLFSQPTMPAAWQQVRTARVQMGRLQLKGSAIGRSGRRPVCPLSGALTLARSPARACHCSRLSAGETETAARCAHASELASKLPN